MARYRPKGLGLERVLGVGALFSTAYGNVGSSIYYALGLVAAFALGLILLLNFDTLIHNVHFGVAPTWSDFVLSITVAMISYTGIETISNLAEEAREPRRLIPRSMTFVVIAVLVIYSGLPSVALSA